MTPRFFSSRLMKNKHDPRNLTKLHEMNVLVRVISCDFVDRFNASIAVHHFVSNLLGLDLNNTRNLYGANNPKGLG